MNSDSSQKVHAHPRPSTSSNPQFQTNKSQKTDNLARVRENQRKSRARKQEHVRELEQQLASSKEHTQQKDIEHRLAVQKLEAENRKLRHLLSLSGVPASAVEDFLRLAEDPATSQKVAIPALRRSEGVRAGSQCQGKRNCAGPCSSDKQMDGDASRVDQLKQPVLPAPEPKMAPQEHEEPVPVRDLVESSSRSQAVCDCLPDDDSVPTNEDVLNTTLCAIAEELINQYNTRGVDMTEIQKKLWDGFCKSGATGEGCRVQNHILFQVLDEISNN